MTDGPPLSPEQPKRETATVGVILILVGIVSLAGTLLGNLGVGLWFLPLLALIFLYAGITRRSLGLVIPGGILAGIGTGIVMIEQVFPGLGSEAQGGLFLLCFAAGWLLIAVLGTRITGALVWWPLIPGSILAVIGSGLLMGGWALRALELTGYLWPVALILVGLYLVGVFRREQR